MNLTQADKNKLEKCCPLFDIFHVPAGDKVKLYVIDKTTTRSHAIRRSSLHARLYAELAERIMDNVANKNLDECSKLLSLTLKELYHIANLYQRCYAQHWQEPLGFCRYELLTTDCATERLLSPSPFFPGAGAPEPLHAKL